MLQTNAVCYATDDCKLLSTPRHREGRTGGWHCFQEILAFIRPRILIVFGSNTVKELRAGATSPLMMVRSCPFREQHTPCEHTLASNGAALTVISIRSLSPPGFNQWYKWSEEHLTRVAERVHALLREAD